MKIAIVLNTSWNVYNFRMGLIREIQRSGHEVQVYAPRDKFSNHLIEAGCTFIPVNMDSRGANPVKDSALIFELLILYRRHQPDIILHYTIKPNIYGSIAAKILGIPVINNVCGLGTVFLKKNMVSRIATLLYKFSFQFPHKVYFQNKSDLTLFLENNMIRKEISELVPGSGIDLEHFPACEFNRNSRFTFLMISRIIVDKGVYEYIEAIRILQAQGIDARFQLLGALDEEHSRGIPEKELRGWIKEGYLEYMGNTNDVRPFIHNADCIVLPSYREGTPRTLLEAASSAKPVVATDVPGCRDVVVDKHNGLLCEPANASDLADKMNQMFFTDNMQLRQYGENGRRKVEEEFKEKIVIDKYLGSIGQLSVQIL